ncbi:MAG: adenine deaminase [Bacteroidetes bacterium]|nr:adenine deaminase [Bacteroidota bacterium]
MKPVELYHYFVDILQQKIYPACIVVADGKILSVRETDLECQHFILPGFIDAHVHIESSMLIPSEFARMAVRHGTVATVSDPHEIANVCGTAGIEYMLANAEKVPFKFHFGAPSCVPATRFETAGATIDSAEIEKLLARDDIFYLSEMMNYPGVLFEEEEVMKKIAAANKAGKPVDGHAPGLRGADAEKYIRAGISTDHECFTMEEAAEKLTLGMKILIREGSAAKNFDALIPLLHHYEDQMMFCCDDKHPDELELHHINQHVKRSVQKGVDLYKTLKAACINPILHYQLQVGMLREGDAADFIIVDSCSDFNILKTVINGETVFENGQSLIKSVEEGSINQFECHHKSADDFVIRVDETKMQEVKSIRVIEALEGQLITKTFFANPKIENACLVSDLENDILKIVVVNRYGNQPIAKAFIKNFGLKRGAIASTVAHDSHNIICVGTSDFEICDAVNALMDCGGGVVACHNGEQTVLPLPVAGLMSNDTAEKVAAAYSLVDLEAKKLGSTLQAPFMTLSFMALLVIPELKLSDQGLFDGKRFAFTELY